MTFTIDNMSSLLEEGSYNNCKDTNLLKSEFSSLRSKFDNLLAEYLKSQKSLDKIPRHEEVMKEKVSCKQCSSTFDDTTIFKNHITNEHSVN